ncbi:MAG: class I tRNA ligase family protein [Planctomycetota bacterium]
MKYDFNAIEQRWQQHWENARTFATPNPNEAGFDGAKPKFYVLDMFPYPSGVGLHVGHPLGYIATDIVARYKRMRGFNVLHPMGFDAFGLPAEQYAVEHNVHPRITTEKNIANMVAQLKRLGMGYDWDRSFATTDPEYVKWTQWIFMQMYHSYFDPVEGKAAPISTLIEKLEGEDYYVGMDGELIVSGSTESLEPLAGIGDPNIHKWTELEQDQRERLIDEYRLAFMAEVEVNWCPGLGTVLANEEVTNEGRSERGNFPVYKRPLKQWMLRITAYADRLIDDLDHVDWPENIKLLQRNWIGKSTGAEVDFKVDLSDETIRVFTTRPDTLFGATYMVLAPEHPLVDAITTPQRAEAVRAYREQAASKSNIDRQADSKEKTGVFTGGHAINPVNREKVPVWIADYVMMGYGTGAIMAVPAHDSRDFEFAKKFNLPIVDVVADKPVAAIYGFVDRYDREPEVFADGDEGKLRKALVDFVAMSVNQDETDYDRVWGVVNFWRKDEDTKQASEQPKGRGSIAMIWQDALEPLMAKGMDKLFETARARRLGTLTGDAFTATEGAISVNSENDEVSLNGHPAEDAKAKITQYLETKGLGKAKENVKLRDWLFSRQRYWGEPFPVLHGPNGEIRTVDEADLPVELPEMEDFKPTGSDDPGAPPQPPLGRAGDDWKTVTVDGVKYTRELNTMPNWAGSCWYYLRYLDNKNSDALVGQDAEDYWMVSEKESGGTHAGGVDLYVGGAEHAVLHLLYARFWHKFLYDLGVASTPEPFGRYFAQGYIQAFYYENSKGIRVEATGVIDTKSGQPASEVQDRKDSECAFEYEGEPVKRIYGKMGKALKNAIAPDAICDQYGCDTLRLYEMYMGPLDQSKVWNTADIVGVHRFLNRLWRVVFNEDTGELRISHDTPNEAIERKVHATVKRVTESMEAMQFNVAIAAMIELNNELVKLDAPPRSAVETLVQLLGPIAPHVAEEIWSRLGYEQYLADADWPKWDEAKLVEDMIEMPVQVNGKLRAKITVSADADQKTIEAAAKEDSNVVEHIEGKTIRKVIVVPKKLINIVVG